MSYVRTSHWVLLTTLGLAAGLLAGLIALAVFAFMVLYHAWTSQGLGGGR